MGGGYIGDLGICGITYVQLIDGMHIISLLTTISIDN